MSAAPFTAGSAFDDAVIVAVPAVVPAVTTPFASTVAIAVLLGLHVTVRSVMPASALTLTASVILSPGFSVAEPGVTVTDRTVGIAAAVAVDGAGGISTLSPHAIKSRNKNARL